MNRWQGIGRIVRDATITFLEGSGTAKTTFTLACNKKYGDREDTVFVPCVLWGERAEKLTDYLEQGKLLYIDGELSLRSIEDNEGNYRNYTNINVSTLEFLSSSNNSNSNKNNNTRRGNNRRNK